MTGQAGIYGVTNTFRDELRTRLAALMGNITAFSTRPIIITTDQKVSADSSGDETSGVIKLKPEEQGSNNFLTEVYEHKPFLIEGTITIPGSGHTTSMTQYLQQLEKIVNDLNESNSRSYHYDMIASIVSYDHAHANLLYTLTREYVKKSA